MQEAFSLYYWHQYYILMQILKAKLTVTLYVLFKHSRMTKFAQAAFAASFATPKAAKDLFEQQLILVEKFFLCPHTTVLASHHT